MLGRNPFFAFFAAYSFQFILNESSELTPLYASRVQFSLLLSPSVRPVQVASALVPFQRLLGNEHRVVDDRQLRSRSRVFLPLAVAEPSADRLHGAALLRRALAPPALPS